MNELEAANILDPETRREALRHYIYDPPRRLAVMEEACRVAAKALRDTKTADHFPDTMEMVRAISKAVQIPAPILSGMKPLTLEQLREMDGLPVYVAPINHDPEMIGWCVVSIGDCDERSAARIPGDNYWAWIFGTYGKEWIAYPYPPAHIDREAWTAKWKRTGKCSSCNMWNDRPSRFCPSCGKAMTDDAWAEQEKRLRG